MKYHGYGRCIVRIQEVKKLSAVIIMSGFFAGIIYVNMFAKNYILSMGIFSEYFLEQYTGSRINPNEYIWYIMKIRILPIVVLLILGNTRFRRIAGGGFLLWTGFAGGMILTTAVLKMTVKGLLLCVTGVLPHFICYVAAYTMILIYLFTYPNSSWNRTKTVSLILFVLLGIISECYINPVLLEIYINVM